jgi:hypothetical protein
LPLFLLAFLALAAVLAPEAWAGMIIFGLDSSTNGDLPNKIDPSKEALTFRFEDTATDQVTVTFDATNLLADNYITTVLFNYDGDATDWNITTFSSQVRSTAQTESQVLSGGDELKAGLFNVRITFQDSDNSINPDFFSGGETAFVLLTGSGLRATDFLVTSIDKPAPNPSAGGWYGAALVEGIQVGGRESSGSIGASTFTVVPEPSSIALLAVGGLGLAAFRLRRRSR